MGQREMEGRNFSSESKNVAETLAQNMGIEFTEPQSLQIMVLFR